jgi:hypothetical protein
MDLHEIENFIAYFTVPTLMRMLFDVKNLYMDEVDQDVCDHYIAVMVEITNMIEEKSHK